MNTARIHIQPLTAHHQPGIDALLASIAAEYELPFYSPAGKTISEQALLPGRCYWVAMDEARVIGTVGIIIQRNYCVLKSMFLDASYRATGVATRLLHTAIGYAVSCHVHDMYLGTMEQFRAAQRFYEKSGFTRIQIHELPADIPLNPVDTVYYRLHLKS